MKIYTSIVIVHFGMSKWWLWYVKKENQLKIMKNQYFLKK